VVEGVTAHHAVGFIGLSVRQEEDLSVRPRFGTAGQQHPSELGMPGLAPLRLHPRLHGGQRDELLRHNEYGPQLDRPRCRSAAALPVEDRQQTQRRGRYNKA
jgi:hypothetical protein